LRELVEVVVLLRGKVGRRAYDPNRTGDRYCINSISLTLEPVDNA